MMASTMSTITLATALGLCLCLAVGWRLGWTYDTALSNSGTAKQTLRHVDDISAQVTLANVKYEAPWGNNPSPEDRVPDAYSIYLRPGYTVTELSETIGRDVSVFISSFSPSDNGAVWFHIRGVDDGLLAAIRSDPGVETVEWMPIYRPE
jgi:hypothetical protein